MERHRGSSREGEGDQGQQDFSQTGRSHDAKQWFVDPLQQTHGGFAHREQVGDAEHRIEELGKIDGDQVAEDAVSRDQKPDQHHRDQSVHNVDVHGKHLLSQSLHHGVGGGVDVHDGDQGGKDADELPGLRPRIEALSQFLGKADEDPCHADGKEEREGPDP